MVKILKTFKIREALFQVGLKYQGNRIVLSEISDIESPEGEFTWSWAKGMYL